MNGKKIVKEQDRRKPQVRRQFNKRMLVLGGIALVYMLVLVLWGSPLLALSTWLGLVDPAKV
jgi:hypothetical protein